MNVYEARRELRRINKRDLFELASNQGISKCLIGGETCGLYFSYKEFNFCISEILRQGCQMESAEKLERHYENPQEIYPQLPFIDRLEMDPLRREEKGVEFKVFFRDCVTRSILHLGKVIERRAKERGNNIRDLLVKAMKDYSDCVENPSTIFLVSS